MPKFREKSPIVDAIQMTGTAESANEALIFIGDQNLGRVFAVPHKQTGVWIVIIETIEGAAAVLQNHWVIRNDVGEFLTCDPDTFSEIYEPVVTQ
jgi:hypothetical protein